MAESNDESLDRVLAEAAVEKEVATPLDDAVQPTITVSQEDMEKFKEWSKADLFREVIRPDLSKKEPLDVMLGVTPFTKEMKISNLNDFQIMLIKEMIYGSMVWSRIGAKKFAGLVLSDANALLSLTPSRNGALLKLMNTEFSIKRIETPGDKKRFFSSGGGEKE